jgi:hypothetical protein
MDAADAGSRERGTTMRMKTLGEAALLLGLLLFGAANSSGTLQLIVQQIQEIGPRQWLQLMAGAMVLNNMALNKPAQFQNASFGAVSSSLAAPRSPGLTEHLPRDRSSGVSSMRKHITFAISAALI